MVLKWVRIWKLIRQYKMRARQYFNICHDFQMVSGRASPDTCGLLRKAPKSVINLPQQIPTTTTWLWKISFRCFETWSTKMFNRSKVIAIKYYFESSAISVCEIFDESTFSYIYLLQLISLDLAFPHLRFFLNFRVALLKSVWCN